MKKLFFILTAVMLVSCGAKNSNTAKEEVPLEEQNTQTEPKALKFPSFAARNMTAEEKAFAVKYDLRDAMKLPDGNFIVTQVFEGDDYIERIFYCDAFDSVTKPLPLCGIMSTQGKWICKPCFHQIEFLGDNFYLGSVKTYENLSADSYDIRHGIYYKPCEAYGYVIDGKQIGCALWEPDSIYPMVYQGKACGYILGHIGNEIYYQRGNKTYGQNISIENFTRPTYQYYSVKNGVLTMWGGAETVEQVKKEIDECYWEIIKIDLKTGKVLYDPFVSES